MDGVLCPGTGVVFGSVDIYGYIHDTVPVGSCVAVKRCVEICVVH